MAEATRVCVVLLGCIGLIVVFFIVSGWTSLEQTEMALKYNIIYHKVSPLIETQSGTRYIGPFNRFLKYPVSIQSFEYTGADFLGRSSDGLWIALGMTVQYELQPANLLQLWKTFEYNHLDYVDVFNLRAMQVIAQMVPNYNAQYIFRNKGRVAQDMKDTLNAVFGSELFSNVTNVLIKSTQIPADFENAIDEATTAEQTINQMRANLSQQEVRFNQNQGVALKQGQSMIQAAAGVFAQIQQNGLAAAQVTKLQVEGELQGYTLVQKSMKMSSQDMVKYIYFDNFIEGNANADLSMFVGIS